MRTRYRRFATACGAEGFTLVEVLIASVLMVLGFTALVAAIGYQGVVIQRGEEITYGTFLANEIHDMAFRMPFADIHNLDGQTYDPALLSTGASQDQSKFKQEITVTPVDANDLATTVGPSEAQAVRLTVTVSAHGKPVVVQTYHLFDLGEIPFTNRDI